MNLILGIDPGISGSFALYDPISKTVVNIWDMPVHDIKGKAHLDLYQMATIVDTYKKDIKLAVIEEPGAMPGQGVTSMFRFGHACGVVQGIVACCMIPMKLLKPSVWKMQMGLTFDKDLSRQKASQMFPKESARFARKKDDGRAEALLLAVFGERLIS